MSEYEFPPGVPEEMQQFIVKKLTRHEMEVDALRHDLVRFFTELTDDQLSILHNIIGQAGDVAGRSEFFQGYITALRESKYGICAGCGEDHEKILKINQPDAAQEEEPPIVVPPGWDEDGNRVASCSSCHGDTYIKVCTHQPGSHGQTFGNHGCPEPLLVPCPECRTPEWYKDDTLPIHTSGGCLGTLLPLPPEHLMICAECGTEVLVRDGNDTD